MEEKIIKVVGEGRAVITPDITRLNIKISKLFEDIDEAYDENDKNIDNMLWALEQVGVTRDNLTPTLFQVHNHLTDYCDDEDEVIGQVEDGYEVEQGFEVILDTDNDKVSQVIHSICKELDNVEISISHDTTNIKPFVKAMLEDAMNDAKEKAEMLAEITGSKIKEAREIKYACHDFSVKTKPLILHSNEEALHCDEAILNLMIDEISIKDHVVTTWLLC